MWQPEINIDWSTFPQKKLFFSRIIRKQTKWTNPRHVHKKKHAARRINISHRDTASHLPRVWILDPYGYNKWLNPNVQFKDHEKGASLTEDQQQVHSRRLYCGDRLNKFNNLSRQGSYVITRSDSIPHCFICFTFRSVLRNCGHIHSSI